MKKNSILTKLWIKDSIIIFAVVILFMMVFVMLWQHTVIEYAFEHEKESIMENQADISNILVQVVFSAELRKGVVLSDEQLENTIKSTFNKEDKLLLFRENKLISGTYSDADIDSQLLKGKLSKNECLLRYRRISDVHYIQAASTVTLQGQEYRIITTTDVSTVFEYEKALMKRTMLMCILLGIIAAALFFILFFFLQRPLRKVNEAVKNAASGNYTKLLKIKRKDEIGELADNINKIMQTIADNMKSLQEIVDQQKNFVNGLSNEMGAPLTSILCYSEIMLKAEQLSRERLMTYAEIILSEGRQLKKLSETLMDFLYVGKINEYDKTEISVKETIDDICNAMTPMFQKKRVYFTKKIHDFMLRVDQELFKTMLYNFLDNAVNASREDDIVEINVYQTNMENIIEISDQNTAFAEQAESVKADSFEGGGSRLGVAFGRKIAAAHNGEVMILNRLHNKGTTIRIIFQQDKEIEV